MHINAVIGNPPYNNDMYIPFVEMGHQLATDCSLFITPAKWQAKGGEKNEAFRQNIVPYMSKIVYYKDSTDIFDIKEYGGISYYIIKKEINSTKEVKVICINDSIATDYETHTEKELKLVNNNIISIIDKCNSNIMMNKSIGYAQSYYVKNTESGNITRLSNDDIEVMQGDEISGYVRKQDLTHSDRLEKYKCICNIMTGTLAQIKQDNKTIGIPKIMIVGPNQVPKGSFPVLKYFDNKNEAESFVSYCYTKLVAFLYNVGICGSTMTQEFWRFVPDPVSFDHIFTDEELYKKYNLTEEEINIIESVIKERK